MSRNIAVGIDIGTYQIKVVVAEQIHEDDKTYPRILGTGFVESKGLRHGYITNISEVSRGLRLALNQAEKTSGLTVIPILASPPEGWRGETGFVRTTLLARYAPDFRERTIFISGPPVMVDTLKKDLKHMGVSRKQIITDHFSGY